MLQSVFTNARERLEKDGCLPSPEASEDEDNDEDDQNGEEEDEEDDDEEEEEEEEEGENLRTISRVFS